MSSPSNSTQNLVSGDSIKRVSDVKSKTLYAWLSWLQDISHISSRGPFELREREQTKSRLCCEVNSMAPTLTWTTCPVSQVVVVNDMFDNQ